ncbi:MAG: hypothetical protein PHI72_03875 [Atribacterota bacterium]|jgi:hypothetical protein|nr:hypothetical protein [Atribacterota bacterium]MDD4896690.1 hypothetical protein [Atribacterota bacterium]MDD5636779.1 hypothetical protein [Atribacterota bacterium]
MSRKIVIYHQLFLSRYLFNNTIIIEKIPDQFAQGGHGHEFICAIIVVIPGSGG